MFLLYTNSSLLLDQDEMFKAGQGKSTCKLYETSNIKLSLNSTDYYFGVIIIIIKKYVHIHAQ